MNERIKELAEQANINIDSFQFSGTPIKHIVDEPSLEKFAKLIVRECCDVLHDNEMGGYRVNYVLKEHFGVEE